MNRPILLICLAVMIQSCWVSRCMQPKTTGYVYDFDNKKPIANCMVNNIVSDSLGYYEFQEIRYKEFTFIGMEAPPIRMRLIYSKIGYVADTIYSSNPFGGGMGKGAHWKMDTVFLKRK